MPSATVPMRSRSARTSPASRSCESAPSLAERLTQAAADRVQLDGHALHLVVEAAELALHPALHARLVLERLHQRLAPRLRAHLGEPELDVLGRVVGERLVERLGARGGALHRAHEPVDLDRHLGVGQLGALDRLADRRLAAAGVADVLADRRGELVELELLPAGRELPAALGALAGQDPVGLLLVEERARARHQVDEQRDDEHQADGAPDEHPGRRGGDQHADVERLGRRVGGQGARELAAAVRLEVGHG